MKKVLAMIAAGAFVCGAAFADGSCPPTRGLTDQDCSTHYLGLGFLDGLFGDSEVMDAGQIVFEASAGTDDPACSPHLAKLVNDVQHAWFSDDCKDASFEEIRTLIDQASQNKLFCRRVEDQDNPQTIDYDLYDLKRIREYIVQSIQQSSSGLP